MTMLAPVRPESLSAQVADTLRQAIFLGELKPGQMLRELGLAKNMNVSQATVREALAQLENYGLVVRTPNRGTAVTQMSNEAVRERLQVCTTLESLACHEAALHATAENFEELENICTEMRSAISSGDNYAAIRLDQRFHQRVWELAHNQVLYRTLDQLTMPMFAFLRLNEDTHQLDGTMALTHDQIVDAMKNKDKQKIEQSVQHHMEAKLMVFAVGFSAATATA